MTTYLNPVVSLYANDNDALIPEHWAREGLMILVENMVMANLVHRDFEDVVANYGDVVNTRRPGEFGIRRRDDATAVVAQDAVATNVAVPLNQYFYEHFVIKDGEASKSFQDLVEMYLEPAMISIANGVDRVLLGQVPQFLTNSVGGLGLLSGTTSYDTVLAARQKLIENKATDAGLRNLVVSPSTETALLKDQTFVTADKKGDDGTALREASLGRILGMNTWMDQNTPLVVATTADTASTTTTAVEPAGETNIAVTDTTGASVGSFCTIVGDEQPRYITATGPGPDVTLDAGLISGTASGAAITYYKSCKIKNAAGYAAGEGKQILVDSYTPGKYPRVGQMLAIGTGASRRTYTVIESWDGGSSDRNLLLDRPLEVAVVNTQECFPGPAGSYNFCFHREALALVTRPLARPRNADSAVVEYNGVPMRITMQYDIDVAGTKVTVDMLAGTAVLDTNLGVVMFG